MYTRVAEQLDEVRRSIPAGVGLVAVSKFHPVEALRAAYDAGQRRFGESRVQELLAKIPQMPDDVEWHFIGHLQTNKVRQLIGKTALIE
ncbi:MAG: YggS family pyridoxal phosphate-dependent enzyme, partial [Muribaculaceae bacterium]|nr:YggS family pyridoxal phosphate-dependent enzyme [Muribaculaceae bacterium]